MAAEPYPAEVVQGAIKSAWPGFVRCYSEAALDRRVDLDLELHIGPTGAVESVAIEEDLDEDFIECLRSKAELLRFPPHTEETVVVSAPIWLG
ncbi:MAG TPA: hypothetical protein QGF58_19825 [Myxococcota bacterium]|nr:hypothetical protein [Myxococcota bacterium]